MNRFTLLSFMLFSIGAQADSINIKPGLWEVKNKMNVNGQEMPDMHEMMADVPPEMREQMKGMMEKNGAGMTDKGMTICITADQIARGEIGQGDPNSDCKMTDMKKSGDKMTMTMHCAAPHKADGNIEMTRVSDTQWKSTMHMKTDQGKMNSESSGKWLKSDCGSVKPTGSK